MRLENTVYHTDRFIDIEIQSDFITPTCNRCPFEKVNRFFGCWLFEDVFKTSEFFATRQMFKDTHFFWWVAVKTIGQNEINFTTRSNF